MHEASLQQSLQLCLAYKQAKPWQKPWLDPGRFLRNQIRKYRGSSRAAGELQTVATFHVPRFTVVPGEAVSDEIASYGVFEPELTEAFLRLIKPGQVVVDIGMHLGYYTTLFGILAGKTGQVHAFEPTPSTREIARRNTQAFPQVVVHPFAVWSSIQTITLRDYGPQWMAFNSLSRTRLSEEPAPAKEIEVQTTTLDQFRQTLARPVSLVKIDAESAEREIVRGAKELLARDRPIVSVEVGRDAGESRRLVEDLIGHSYAPWEFKSGRFIRHEPREAYDYDNLIFAGSSQDLASI